MTVPGEDTVRRCTIYASHGEAVISSLGARPEPPRRLRAHADSVPLQEVMSHELICARPDLEISHVIGLMARHRIGCLPVVDASRRPIGMITKQDVVEQLAAGLDERAPDAPLPDVAPATAEDVMMPLALVLEQHATVAAAASMMESEDTHHVLVVGVDGVLLGVVSSKDLVGWLVTNERLFDGGDGWGDHP